MSLVVLDLETILASIELFAIFFIGIPIQCTSLKILKRDWNKTYIVKRPRIFIITFSILVICIELLSIPITCILVIIQTKHAASTALQYFADHIGFASTFTAVVLYSIRIWLLYFDMNLAKYNSDKLWLSAMDPAEVESNWYKN